MKKKSIIVGAMIGIGMLTAGGVYAARKGAMSAIGDKLTELTEQVRELKDSLKSKLKK